MFSQIHPADYNTRRNRKFDKDFAGELDFKYMKFPVKIRHIYKIEEALVFLFMKTSKIHVK